MTAVCHQVIYHLNNKNEDNELDLQDMAEQYETEIEQILKDTADKVHGDDVPPFIMSAQVIPLSATGQLLQGAARRRPGREADPRDPEAARGAVRGREKAVPERAGDGPQGAGSCSAINAGVTGPVCSLLDATSPVCLRVRGA